MGRFSRSFVLVGALALTCGGCGSGSGKRQTASATAPAVSASTSASTPAGASASPPHCSRVVSPAPKGDGDLKPPKSTLDPKRSWTAVVRTSCGSFTIALDVKRAPKTTASFASLAQRGFYNDLTFDRIVAGFVIQGGDPPLDTTGGPGYSVVEKPPRGQRYTRGVVAMAKSGIDPAGSSGSSFFVVAGDASNLPPDYALVGRVTQGGDVVAAIDAVPSDPGNNNMPLKPVVIRGVSVSGSTGRNQGVPR